MQDGSYIKIFRSMLDWEWYEDINTKVVFIHMLLMANWKDGNFRGTTVPRGSFISSIKNLSDETKLTEQEVRTAIKHLKKTKEVTSKSTNRFTVFTVNNYSLYQAINQQDNKQATSKQQTNNKLLTTIEERKKERIKEKDIINFDEIVDLYHSICVSFSCVTKLTDARKRKIKARLKQFTIDDFKKVFQLAEESEFLKGCEGWKANFDWLIEEKNMLKVMDGTYQGSKSAPKQNQFNGFPQRDYSQQDYADLERKLLNKNG